MTLRPFGPACLALAVAFSCPQIGSSKPASAKVATQPQPSIVYRSDETDATALGLASQPQFSGTGIVALTNESGSGNIIAPNWVLTAKHVVTVDGNIPTPAGNAVTFYYAGGNQVSDSIYVDSQSDMALVHFAAALPANLAIIPPNLNGSTKVQPVGAMIWNVGYGSYGNYGGTVNSSNGGRRGGTNIVDSYSSPYLIFDNDNTDGTEFECSTGPGDSGGPMYQQNGYQWIVSAIVYGAGSQGFIDTDVTHDNFISTTTGIAFTRAAAPAALKWNSTYLNPTSNSSKVVTTLTDGAGTWDTTRLDFTDGKFTYSWENGTLLPVTFGVGSGAAGTVTLTTPINISNLTFAATGSGAYNITGTSANPLTLAAAGSSITVNQGVAPLVSAVLAGTGALTKAGVGNLTLGGVNTYTGGTNIVAGGLAPTTPSSLGTSGDILLASGAQLNVIPLGSTGFTLTNGRTLTADGSVVGTLNVSGTLTGNGTISNELNVNADGLVTAATGTLTLMGNVTNNGTIRLTGGAVLNAAGAMSFVNNGVLDLISGSAQLPPNFTNGSGGKVLTASSVQVTSAVKSASAFTLTVNGYSGHTYQLQRSPSLTDGSYTNLGSVQSGSTGTTLTFTDSAPLANQGFYRVVLTP